MGAFARTFRELEVYQNALQLALDVHEFCKSLPVEERYVLADQMRRSSRSVCGNITEAWRKRRYKAAFVSKLSDAETEATEMQCWLDMGVKLKHMKEAARGHFDQRYERVIGQLVSMIENAGKWCTL